MRRAPVWVRPGTSRGEPTLQRPVRARAQHAAMKKLLTVPAMMLATAALAQPVISAQSIIVNPAPSTVNVRVWVDKDPTGQRIPNYAEGETIRIFTSVDSDAYVYLFNLNAAGQVTQILPNRLGGSNFLRAGTVRAFPGQGDNFVFNVAAPYGQNQVFALASRTELNLSQISDFTSGQAFANVRPSGSEGLAQALSIVVNPVPQQQWNSAVAFFNVVRGVAAQPTTPNYAYPVPNLNLRTWRVTISERSLSATQVYTHYTTQLQQQGYRVQSTHHRGSNLEVRMVSGRSTATLTVRVTGNGYQVEIQIR